MYVYINFNNPKEETPFDTEMVYLRNEESNASGNISRNGSGKAVDVPLIVYEEAIASILTVFTILSFITNICTIITYAKYKCLRTKHDMLVINLAITNLIITIGISFYSTYTLFPGDILHMKLICLNLFVFIFGGILTSLLVLFCLTLERYLCILHPIIHNKIKRHHVVLVSFMAYVAGFAYSIIPFLLKNDWNRHHLCVADVFPFEFGVAEQIFGLFIIFVIIVINVLVYKTALSQVTKINTLLKHFQNMHKRKRRFRQKGKAFVTVFLLSGVSLMCWVPLLIVFGLESNPKLSERIRWLLTQLLYVPVALNSSLSIFIISYRNKHLKDAIKSMFCKRKHECNRNPNFYD